MEKLISIFLSYMGPKKMMDINNGNSKRNGKNYYFQFIIILELYHSITDDDDTNNM